MSSTAMTWIFLLIFGIFLNNGVVECIKVRVTVADGKLEGWVDKSSTGKTNFTRFHGIPYAKPPLKDLRFKAPQPPVPWKGVRDATLYGPMCIQRDRITNKIVGSEDCLYLNVYTPNMKPSKLLAVIFVIPGYFLLSDSGDDDYYAPGFLMDYDIVLVTINYRLGPFGFLCADTKDVPGNAALKDQILALKWVQRNIKQFGGDPSKVTIYGNAGGAVSASLHYVSPLACGLFNRAILVSGVFYCDWSSPIEAKRQAFGLGRALGLNTNDPKELVDFLRLQPPQNMIVNTGVFVGDNTTNYLNKVTFTPVRETYFGPGQYMTDNPVDLLMNGKVNKVDIMLGHTKKDALFHTYRNLNLILDTYPYYYRLFTPALINYLRSPTETLEYSYAIEKYYLNNESVNLDTIRQFVEMFSFSTVQYPTHEWMYSLPTDSSNNRYFFHFHVYTLRNYFARQAKSLGVYEATTRDEAGYLFDGLKFYPKLNKVPELWKYVEIMCTLWTDFAKYGNPTPTKKYGVQWPVIGNEDRRYMVIDNDGLKLTKFSSGGTPESPIQQEFWAQLYKRANVTFRDSWTNDDDSPLSKSLSTLLTSSSCLETCFEIVL